MYDIYNYQMSYYGAISCILWTILYKAIINLGDVN